MEERIMQEKLYQDFLHQDFIVTAGHTALMRSVAVRLRRRMTPSERHLWQYLRANRLGGLHFRRQQIIGRFVADFYCDAARLAVELDGPIHDDQRGYDAERDRVIEGYGLCVLRFTNDQSWADLNGVRRRILGDARRLILSPSLRADPPLGGKGG